MPFIDESLSTMNINNNFKNVFCHVFPSSGIVIEGYEKIFELSSKKIILNCSHNSKIEVIGCELKIKEIAHKEISINGKISSIAFK